jgi:hypothetical protein
VGVVSAHVHTITKNGQEIANGQNHPGFVSGDDGFIRSCKGVAEPPNSGPSWYGMETAHHGRDLEPGAGDGCYTNVDDPEPGLRPPDNNPAIQ